MSDKENLKWTIVGFVIGSTTTTLYDLFKELFLNIDYSNIDSIKWEGLITLAIGVGFTVYYGFIRKSEKPDHTPIT